MNYNIFGGFEVPRKPRKNAVVDARERRVFWEEIEAKHPGLTYAIGCYVFAVRAGGGIIPWYVGKTRRQTFRQECFSFHKLVYYNDVISSTERGMPLLYLVPRVTPAGRFATTAPESEIDFLENLLIGRALQRNPSLKNTAQTKFLKQLHVPGVVNSRGRPDGTTAAFKRMLGA